MKFLGLCGVLLAAWLGKIKRGDLVVMIQSGLGWNQAAAAIRMTPCFSSDCASSLTFSQ